MSKTAALNFDVALTQPTSGLDGTHVSLFSREDGTTSLAIDGYDGICTLTKDEAVKLAGLLLLCSAAGFVIVPTCEFCRETSSVRCLTESAARCCPDAQTLAPAQEPKAMSKTANMSTGGFAGPSQEGPHDFWVSPHILADIRSSQEAKTMSEKSDDAMNSLEKQEIRSRIEGGIARARELAQQEAFYGLLIERLWSADQMFRDMADIIEKDRSYDPVNMLRGSSRHIQTLIETLREAAPDGSALSEALKRAPTFSEPKP